jgi:hypothetical protein
LPAVLQGTVCGIGRAAFGDSVDRGEQLFSGDV